MNENVHLQTYNKCVVSVTIGENVRKKNFFCFLVNINQK